LLLLSALACLFASAASAQERRFGIIEIGGSGVKASVVEIVTGRNAEGAEELDLAVVHSYPAENLNPVYPEQVDTVAAATARLAQDMSVRHNLSPLRIYIVGASGLADLAHRARLTRAVDAAVAGGAGSMRIISPQEQARFSFNGVVDCEHLAHRRRDVVFVDVSSAEITAAATAGAASPCGAEEMATLGLPVGVKSVVRAAGGAPIRERADALINTPIANAFASGPAQFLERPRVYLGGGIAWTLATFLHPEDGRRYVPIDAADIRRLREQLASDPLCVTDPAMAQRRDPACRFLDINLATIGDVEQRVRASADHREIVSSIYTLEQLRAGSEILAALSQSMRLSRRHVFFARPSDRAWMLGFLLAQETGDELSVAAPAGATDPTTAP
jgi:hypothetical protein